jgi:hypothetical protein
LLLNFPHVPSAEVVLFFRAFDDQLIADDSMRPSTVLKLEGIFNSAFDLVPNLYPLDIAADTDIDHMKSYL